MRRRTPVKPERVARLEGPVAVIGDGGWGTALALVLHGRGIPVRLWSREPDYAAAMERSRANPRYLPGVALPPGLRVTADGEEALGDAVLAVSAVPTQHLAATWKPLAGLLGRRTPLVSVSKGLEIGTLRRPTEILADVAGPRPLAALSGPSHAEEVARGLPCAVVAASRSPRLAASVQALLSSERFRVYRLSDVVGVEFAGAAKNVVAVAAGISDGLGLGDSAKAALITRGAVEMARLGRALGARQATFHGLAGIGDLIVTCASRHGRNRALGERLGRGESLAAILASVPTVAEGVPTAKALVALTRRLRVEMPIAAEVHRILHEGKDPRRALADLMGRAPKSE
jgi:glycerol-3-phosphate dehydrogenase (NAD(P)+)